MILSNFFPKQIISYLKDIIEKRISQIFAIFVKKNQQDVQRNLMNNFLYKEIFKF